MNNIFTQGQGQQGQQGQQGNIFSQNNAGRNTGAFNQNSGNVFAQGQQGGRSNVFAQGNQQTTGMFNQQNTAGQNVFAQQGQQGNQNVFAQGNQGNQIMFNQGNQGNPNLLNQGNNNVFNQGNQQGNNVFNQGNQQGNNVFNQGNQQQGNMLNQQNQQMNGQGQNIAQNPNYNLANCSPEQQQQMISLLTPEYIRELIAQYRKLLDPKRLQALTLSRDNTLAGEKANKMATNFNIKAQVIYVKKQVKDNVVTPIKALKDKNETLEKETANFSGKVFDKLQKYKQRLVQAVSQSKMIEQVRKQIEELDGQIREFFRPLFNAQQSRSNFSFFDPDPFCVSVSERLLRNMTTLDNKMDELLACEGAASKQAIQTGAVVEQLVDYYQNVAVTLREFSERYNSIKRKVMQKNRLGNPEQAQKRLSEKASYIVSKEMQTYELLKEIELLLEKREKRIAKIGRIL